MDAVSAVLLDQCGVVSRRQLLACGLTASGIERLVHRRELCRVHPGVYVDHTGPLTWMQRAWAAVQFSWPAVLAHDSALRAVDGPGRRDRDEALIHVAMDRGRKLAEPSGVRIHRSAHLDSRALWHVGPPRLRYEHAVLDVAALEASETLRLSWGQVFDRPCRTADAIGRVLRRRGWIGELLRCPDCG